jgi:hypothetical protein
VIGDLPVPRKAFYQAWIQFLFGVKWITGRIFFLGLIEGFLYEITVCQINKLEVIIGVFAGYFLLFSYNRGYSGLLNL